MLLLICYVVYTFTTINWKFFIHVKLLISNITKCLRISPDKRLHCVAGCNIGGPDVGIPPPAALPTNHAQPPQLPMYLMPSMQQMPMTVQVPMTFQVPVPVQFPIPYQVQQQNQHDPSSSAGRGQVTFEQPDPESPRQLPEAPGKSPEQYLCRNKRKKHHMYH